MARPKWSGALTFAGFPINVRVYPTIESKGGDSFKQLAPTDLQPVKQVLVDTNGNPVERKDCLKGVEVKKDAYVSLSPEAVEAIQSAERTDTLEAERMPLAETVPLHLSKSPALRVVPDPKVPGSEGPFKILWNGLRKSKRAYVTKWTPRAGSRDEIIVFVATQYGIDAHTLPFENELHADLPEWKPEEDADAAKVFEQVVDANYDTTAFAHHALTSDYAERRAAAVKAAVAGEEIVMPAAAEAQASVPDLMAAMQASLSGAKSQAPKKAPAKKPAAKPKPKAKA